ncbi:translocation and assembly module TamB [Kushneria avicenniae]|uniref:Translocation and assembly module TamB n=1 Tax=Kushneria avicenniae TaxID=402385 RepID=A0A1I1FN09_9GAMM|nr:translocation/assembly module TamB domain-containing protein [Kushneria avicenniae]SFB99038.1 translocation and assembly module TamB [Kushneria avicenniae]
MLLPRAILWIVVTLIALVLIVAGVVLSPWGTSKLLEQAQSRGFITYDHAEGALLDDFTIQGLHLDLPALRLDVDQFALHWSSDCLLRGRLCMDQLQVSDVDVVLRGGNSETQKAGNDDSTMSRLGTPLPVEVRDLRLDDIHVRLADGTRVELGHFHTSAVLEGSHLTLGETRLEDSRVVLASTPGLDQPDLLDSSVDVRVARRVVRPDMITGEAIASAQTIAASAPPVLLTDDATTVLSQGAVEGAMKVASPEPPTVLETLAELGQKPLANPLIDIIGKTDDQERIVMPEITLPLDIDAEDVAINRVRVDGETPIVVHQLALAVQTRESDIDLQQLTLDSSVARASMSAKASLKDDYPLTLSLAADILQAPARGEHVEVDAHGALSDLNLSVNASGPVNAALSAHADVLAPNLPFRLQLSSPQVRWPLEETPGVAPWLARDIAVNAEGSLDGYQLGVGAHVEAPNISPLDIRLDGDGDIRHFNWAPLAVTTGDGRVEASGTATWSPALDVNSSLDFNNLRLEDFTDAVTGRLNGKLSAGFHQQGEAWRVELPEFAIKGTLQGRALSLQGRLNGNSNMQWHIDQLDLRQGSNRISASGDIGDRLSLNADISAPALDTILPELGGSANGQIRLAGTLDNPAGNVDLRGQGLRYQNNRIGAFRLMAKGQGIDNPSFNVDLDVSDISAVDQRIRRVSTTLNGTLKQHRMTLDIDGGDGLPVSRVDMALEGGLDQVAQRYTGTITPLEVSAPQGGDIALEGPLRFTALLDQSSVTAGPFCLVRRQGGRLCSVETLQASADSGRAALRLSDIDLALANDYLPPEWRLAGGLEGDINAQWSQAGSRWNVDTDLSSQVDVRGQNAQGQPFSLPHLGLQLNAEATPDRAQARIDMTLRDAGSVRLNADIGDPLGSRTLAGRLQVNGVTLSPYTPLVAALNELQGQLNGDVALAGTLIEPRLNGSMALSDVRARGDQLPVSLDDARVAMNFQGDRGTLDGYLQVGNARWNLDGNANWPTTENWQANMALRGGNSPLEIRMPEFGRLRVAPDIQVAANPQRLDINGDVRIPWARLEIGQIPASAVKPSSDEVIVTREEYEARQQKMATVEAGNDIDRQLAWANTQDLEAAGMEVNVGVNIIVGDDVQLAAYGLNANVKGRLNVRQSASQLQLFGDVALEDGRFQALGQDLLIRRGQVLFSGPPGQPYLNIEAIRNPDNTADNVIAGLRVTGPADQPELEIFSEPGMNESRALSYLLRGRAPDASGDSDGMLTSALIGLSLSRSGKAIGQLGESFGIDDLSLDTSGSGDESQVVVSGYLFDDLQVSYGVGLFSSIAELTLRYKLIQNLYLQAVSGANQAVDLIYTFSLGRTPDSPN